MPGGNPLVPWRQAPISKYAVLFASDILSLMNDVGIISFCFLWVNSSVAGMGSFHMTHSGSVAHRHK